MFRILLLPLLLLAAFVFADVETVSTGGSRYEAYTPAGELISSHTTQHKATDALLNWQQQNCTDACTGYIRRNLELRVTYDPYSEPTPTPEPEPEPVGGAYYAYTDNVAESLPLADATLLPQTVYIFWRTPGAQSATFYCCKGLTGAAEGEPHLPATNGLSTSIDLSQFTTAGGRELYVDYVDGSGAVHHDNYTVFNIDVPPTVSATLNWDRPPTRVDGSPLHPEEIDYYTIRHTTDGMIANYNVPGEDTQQEVQLEANRCHSFAINVIDTGGRDSDFTALLYCDLRVKPYGCTTNAC